MRIIIIIIYLLVIVCFALVKRMNRMHIVHLG